MLMGLTGSVVWSDGGEGRKRRRGSREEVASFVRQSVLLYAWKGVSFPQQSQLSSELGCPHSANQTHLAFL